RFRRLRGLSLARNGKGGRAGAAARAGGAPAGVATRQVDAGATGGSSAADIPFPRSRLARVIGRALRSRQPHGQAYRRQPADPGADRPLDVRLALQAAPSRDTGLRRCRARHRRPLLEPTDHATRQVALTVSALRCSLSGAVARAEQSEARVKGNESGSRASRERAQPGLRLKPFDAELPEQERQEVRAFLVLRLLRRPEAVSGIVIDAQKYRPVARCCGLQLRRHLARLPGIDAWIVDPGEDHYGRVFHAVLDVVVAAHLEQALESIRFLDRPELLNVRHTVGVEIHTHQ